MKIQYHLMAAALAATCGSATAQSNLTLYGIVDLGLVAERGGVNGPLNKLSSGAASVSRVGLRGTEDLGGGLSAIFTLESGVKADTGEQDNAGVLFQRQSWMGLRSKTWGTLTLGRQYTPFYTTFSNYADPFATSYAGTARNLFPVSGATTRVSNSVLYASPEFHGFSADLQVALGEQAGALTAGRQTSYALTYRNGALNLRLGRLDRNSDIAGGADRDSGSNTILAANYDFGFIKLYGAYQEDRGYNVGTLPNTSNPYGGVPPTPSDNSRELIAGFTMPLGKGSLIASHIHKDDRSSFNQDARQNAIGYVYPLSARTNVYAAYAHIDNKHGAGYTVGNNGEVGSGDSALNVGLRHSF